jgi:hypothetical protein
MIINSLENIQFTGVIDRTEGAVVVIETAQGFIHLDKSLFPFRPEEGLFVYAENGRIEKDEAATKKARARAEKLLNE